VSVQYVSLRTSAYSSISRTVASDIGILHSILSKCQTLAKLHGSGSAEVYPKIRNQSIHQVSGL
jgi:hypothetical protein